MHVFVTGASGPIGSAAAAELGVPVRQVPADQAETHSGWLAALPGTGAPVSSASSAATRPLQAWKPARPGLPGLAHGEFFQEAQR